MFESWVTRPQDRERLESNPLRRELDVFANLLQSQGYPPRTVRRYLFAAAAFGRWTEQQGHELRTVDESALQLFFAGRRRQRCGGRRRGRLSVAVSGVRRFVGEMRARALMPAESAGQSPSPIDKIVRAFDSHLEHVGGLVAGTRKIYGRYARALLETRFGTGVLDFGAFDAECIGAFVRAQGERLGRSSRRSPVTATRTFLRFLAGRGLVADGLVGAVPTVRQWKHASLPSYLSAEDLAAVLASGTASTHVALRDRAMLLILARLGLRSCELATLRLEDLCWHEGVVLVRGAKSRRERSLPLPGDVGVAITSYLCDARPASTLREVFLAVRAPHHALTPSAISCVVASAMRRAGVASAHRGAHTLRHTVATRMVRAGATFKQVADVLGHARIDTTAIYAKLDLDTLAAVALPWPEATP